MKLKHAQLEMAKTVILEYIKREFEEELTPERCDEIFKDMTNIGLAYTTLTDEEVPIQVSLDLENMKLKTYIGTEDKDEACLVECIDCTFEDIISGFSFDVLVSGWQSYIEEHADRYLQCV